MSVIESPTPPSKTTPPGPPRVSGPAGGTTRDNGPGQPGSPRRTGRSGPRRFGPARQDQIICLVVAFVLLVIIFLYQPFLARKRAALVQTNDQTLGNLAIAFPRLTLGGFRGVLAMVMWERAESAKNHRKWVPLETDYNVIAKLEPYFASAYVFNAWNQSYNLSAQFHNEGSKYKWVLDGLCYLYKGQRFNPNNINIIAEEGNDFFLKLGGSFERRYYTQHWRFDIAHEYEYVPHGKNVLHDNTLAEVRTIVSQPVFKCQWIRGNGKLRRLGHGVEFPLPWYHNGKMLKCPYGVSPYYFAYMEYMKAKSLHKRPEALGVEVLDAWPGMSLRLWCKDDLQYSQTLTRRMFLHPNGPLAKRFDATVLNIRDCYRNVQINAPQAVKLLQIHDRKYPDDIPVQFKHIIQSLFFKKLGQAESMMFEGLVQWQLHHRKFEPGDAADRDLSASIPLYQQAAQDFIGFLNATYPNQPTNPDRLGDMKYVAAIEARIKGIQQFQLTARRKPPNLNFLIPWTCEH